MGSRGSLGGMLLLMHSVQLWMYFSSCAEIPGHYTDCLALRRHLWIPWCPWCILPKISCCFVAGMTILLPWSSRFPLSVSCPRASQYGSVTSLSLVLPGQPSRQYLITIEHTGSSFCACSRLLRVVGLAGR